MLIIFRVLFSLSILLISANVFGATRAVNCNGCSDINMANAATDVATVGTDTVYVFNRASQKVKKFLVETYREDSIPFTIVKEATELTVESNVSNDYKNVVNDSIQNEDREIILPIDFAIKSAAGAALSPNTAKNHINNHLNSLNWMATTKLNLTKLMVGLISNAVPLLDLGELVQNTVIVVQFPDGSVEMYKVEFVFNLNNSEVETIVDPVAGTATDQAGNPIPARASEFGGRTFEDTNGSLSDWVEYARDHDVTILDTQPQSPPLVPYCYRQGPGHLICVLHTP